MVVEEETGLENPPKEFSLKFVNLVLDYLDIKDKEISIVFTGDDSISKLNKFYRDKDESTDVLSFCQNDETDEFSKVTQSNSLGDIIISLDTLKRNTKYFKVTFEEELNRLLIHGILHLSGMDHLTNNSDEEMLLLQEKILKELKLDFKG
ncbi:MAG: rRNA maturation RNase YbeY [Bacteroidetes bacterium]|nr:rRNA maturation RNase YbeY [Bacteroidota bacterium]